MYINQQVDKYTPFMSPPSPPVCQDMIETNSQRMKKHFSVCIAFNVINRFINFFYDDLCADRSAILFNLNAKSLSESGRSASAATDMRSLTACSSR
jgi:hypothetical protein